METFFPALEFSRRPDEVYGLNSFWLDQHYNQHRILAVEAWWREKDEVTQLIAPVESQEQQIHVCHQFTDGNFAHAVHRSIIIRRVFKK